jgi:putative spermidine/putrescine transport system ATP-binding protein
LDAQIRTRLRREIRELLKQIKVPSIFITHDQEEALELADHIAVLNKGRLEQIGSPFEVYNEPRTEHVATFLGAANILAGSVMGGNFVAEDVALPIGKDMRLKEGEEAKLVFRPEDIFLRRPENLSQNYTKLTEGIVDEVSFIGAFERVLISIDLKGKDTIFATRPKTEVTNFPLTPGQKVPVGLVRYRVIKANPTVYRPN